MRAFLPFRIEVVSTGNELLDGSIADTNTQRLAGVVREFGLEISRVTVIGDEPEAIATALSEAVMRADAVVVSGGLGPTSDDLTLEIAAKTFGRSMQINAGAKANVFRRMKALKRKTLNDGHKKQFAIPSGSKALSNDEGTAPGVQLDAGDRTLFFLPGVPREYQFILQRHLRPWFSKRLSSRRRFLFILKVFAVPESELNELVKKLGLPKGVEAGFRTKLPENHMKFWVEAGSRKGAERKIGPLLSKIRKHLGSKIFSETSKEFEESIFESLLKQKKTVAICESCTGGLASAMLTSVPGSSKVLDRAFVVYTNQAKQEMLGVQKHTLDKFGAVSKEVVIEMVKGALSRTKVDKAVAISGIAGPSGGSTKKPVGTIWIAAGSRKKIATKVLQLSFTRQLNQRWSAYEALKMLAEI